MDLFHWLRCEESTSIHFLLCAFLFKLYLHMSNCQLPKLVYRCRPNTAIEAIEAMKVMQRCLQPPGNRKSLKSAKISPEKFSCQYLIILLSFSCVVHTKKKKRKKNNGFSGFPVIICSEMVSLGSNEMFFAG